MNLACMHDAGLLVASLDDVHVYNSKAKITDCKKRFI